MTYPTIFGALRCATLFAIACSGSFAHADHWAHWRGPDGNAVAPDADPPIRFNDSTNLKWKVPIEGRGSGSPVVWDDSVFVVSAVPLSGGDIAKHQFVLLCIDRETGRQRWRRVATEATPHQGTHNTNGFASASPVTDGEHVYASFGSRGLYCYTMDGILVWKRTDFPP
ncbi:outer membrane protein assembly factor BamB family protein, partial [Rhodopirellula sallentina]|uniref:outer membrane protein assembly factor BamB family protein n=1 Tax=Rhodopirellula sallentina TaxID=1263869 RepID=UPI0005C7B55E